MIKLENVSVEFVDSAQNKIKAVKDVSFSIEQNGLYFIIGKSGSGKTTLLNVLGGLLSPTRGKVFIKDKELDYSSKKELSKYRQENVSFVFQDYNLISDFTIEENLQITGCDNDTINEILKYIGLDNKIHTKVNLLSGGEKQRLAIGRALANDNFLILLDEPTANLDAYNSEIVFSLLKKMSQDHVIIIASHDLKSAEKYGDYIFHMDDGAIVDIENNKKQLFSFHNFNFLSDDFLNFCLYLKNKSSFTLLVKSFDKEEKVEFSSYKDIIGDLKSSLVTYEGKDIDIEVFLEHDDIKDISSLNDVHHNPSFPFFKQLKYAFKLLKNKIFMNILSIICCTLCCFLLAIEGSIVFYDLPGGLYRAVSSNNLEYVSLQTREYNDNLDTYENINTGKYLYDLSASLIKEKPLISINATINSVSEIHLFVIDEPIVFNNITIDEPQGSEVILTSFVSSLLDNSSKGNISFETIRNNSISCNLKYIDDEYDSEIKTRYFLKELSDMEKDIVDNKYKCGFISYDFVKKLYNEEKSFNGIIPSPYENGRDVFFQEKRLVEYKKISNEKVEYGESPKKIDEVAISSKYFEVYLKRQNENLKNPNDAIGKKLYFFNSEESPNKVMYRNDINLYDIAHEVTIVGIVNDELSSNVYVSEDYHKAYSEIKMYYGSELKADVTSLNTISKLRNNNIRLNSNATNVVENTYSFFTSDFSIVLIVLEIIFLILTSIFISITCNSNVKNKIKEICVMDSIGIPKKQITGIFLLVNLILLLISIFFATILTIIGFIAINHIFMSPNVFNINFSLLSFNIGSIIIALPIVILIFIISTFIPFMKLRKFDLSVALKTFDN